MKVTNRRLTRESFFLTVLAGILILCACRSTLDEIPTGTSILTQTATPERMFSSLPSHVPTATPHHTPSMQPSLTPSATPNRTTPPPLERTPLPHPTGTRATARQGEIPIYGYRVVNVYPHDRAAFTQGLVFDDGVLYEGTGLRGRSTLRRVDLETGAILQLLALPEAYFGEGITTFEAKIYQLTWQSNTGFIYDKRSFDMLGTFFYPTEGWGLTHDGRRLIMSDGTATLHFLDPETLEETGKIEVYDDQGPVARLNELEYVRGEIYANVWQTDRIARIDPHNGRVVAWIDLQGLLSPEDYDQPVDFLNGIAYDMENDRLLVTGKLWPKLFEIELVPRE